MGRDKGKIITEGQIKMVYRLWKKKVSQQPCGACPDEESLTLFIDGALTQAEELRLKKHLLSCQKCAQVVSLASTLSLSEAGADAPQELKEWAKDLVSKEYGIDVLEIILRLKGKAQELINTTGSLLLGERLVPVLSLRAKGLKETERQIKIVKDFSSIKLEVDIERQAKKSVNIIIFLRNLKTSKPLEDLRVTLLKDNLEIESYICEAGRVNFKDVSPGAYSLKISKINQRIGTINLELRDK